MKDYQDLNDYEIVYMVSENDEGAKNVLFDKYRPLIMKMAYNFYKENKQYGIEVEDFIQEGYFALYTALSNYSDSRDCLFYTYAIRSIKSKMLNLCKRYKTGKNRVFVDSVSLDSYVTEDSILMDYIENKDSPNPVLELDKSIFYKELKDAVYSNSIIKSSVFELKLNGFSTKDISTLLNISTSLVSRYYVQFKNKLKTLLNYN